MKEFRQKIDTPYNTRPYGVHRHLPQDKNLPQAVLAKTGSVVRGSRGASPEAIRRRGVAIGVAATLATLGAVEVISIGANRVASAQHQNAAANERAQHAYQAELARQAALPGASAIESEPSK